MSEEIKKESLNFIESIIEEHNRSGRFNNKVHTRFPPEPNGYLHIGHAKSICLNFGLAERFGGLCNLRFDDTNPVAEEQHYIDAIRRDIQWLGFDWEDREFYASDYFERFYEFAVTLINKGKAYVDESPQEEIKRMRGIPTEPGIESPYRNRDREENLDLFRRMKEGEFDEGSRVLRAKIDMSSPNMHMRDPIIYRILKAHHHRTDNEWNIYPMYDFAHGLSDSIEKITHSVCTLEFEVHRPLYDWFLDELDVFHPQQVEFAKLALNYTVLSKRNLLQLVNEKLVDGWDDPRMPTLSGLRRRGYTPEAIKNFAERVGVAKRDNVIDLALLEFSIREDLNKKSPRVMAVLDPIKLVITNYPEGKTEEMEIINNPEDLEMGSRMLSFSREIYIEKSDFMLDPPKKYFRLSPGSEVRLKNAYIIRCDDHKLNEETGEIEELHCTYFPESRSGSDTSGKKVKGTIHWVEKGSAIQAEVRLYDRLYTVEHPTADKSHNFKEFLNPESLMVLKGAFVESSLRDSKELDKFQFLRMGYFCLDPDSTKDSLIFNRTVGLRDTWAKISDKK